MKANEKSQQHRQQWLHVVWRLAIIVAVGIAIWPITYGVFRLTFVVCVGVGWGGLILRTWRLKAVRITLVSVTAFALGLVMLPGRDFDQSRLRASYIRQLRSYLGTRYVWGGENSIGIDCSGLARRPLVNAALLDGAFSLNPRLIRAGLALWWNDLSAQAILDGHAGRTRTVIKVDGIRKLDHARIQRGDVAVTDGGIHTLIYLGEQTWIEADPALHKVMTFDRGTQSPWLTPRVVFVRWTLLDSAAQQ